MYVLYWNAHNAVNTTFNPLNPSADFDPWLAACSMVLSSCVWMIPGTVDPTGALPTAERAKP